MNTVGQEPQKEPLVISYTRRRPTDLSKIAAARALQQWLNTHRGIALPVDSWPAQATSEAYRQVTGQYLPGDPRL